MGVRFNSYHRKNLLRLWLKSGSKIPGILKLISQNTHNLLTLNTDAGTKIAAGLSLREIDLITWPDVYVPQQSPEAEPLEATLQIKLKKDKKEFECTNRWQYADGDTYPL